MEYFEESINQSNVIEIWCEDRGRKSNTYIHGWNIDDDALKEHLKTMKKTKGCNGSLKEMVKETGKIKVLLLQGNHKDYVYNYIKSTGVDESSIKIKV
jgi:translation initiation factor 1 (eIF-1/SUI1)